MRRTFQAAMTTGAVALALLVTAPGTALGQAEIAGNWVLSIGSSEFGQSPAPDSAFLSIEAAGEQLVMHEVRHFSSDPGTRNSWFDIALDGETHMFRTDDGEFDVRASWEDETLVMQRTVLSNVGELQLSERFDLESGNLVINREIDVPGYGPVYQVMRYEIRN